MTNHTRPRNESVEGKEGAGGARDRAQAGGDAGVEGQGWTGPAAPRSSSDGEAIESGHETEEARHDDAAVERERPSPSEENSDVERGEG